MSSQTDSGRGTRYEGYSDYNVVSRNVANAVDNAVDAYARIQSKHSEDARIKPEVGAQASAHILGAALRLLPELEEDLDDVEKYEIMVDNWTGRDGYIESLMRSSLVNECPEWLKEFVIDIRRAGWQLGYLRAGRTSEKEPDDVVERDTEAMFE